MWRENQRLQKQPSCMTPRGSLSGYSGDQLWQRMEIFDARCCRRYIGTALAGHHVLTTWARTKTLWSGKDCVGSEIFVWVTGDDYLYEAKFWIHGRSHMALDEERTREDGDVDKVLLKFSVAHYWNSGSYTSCAPEEKLLELRAVGYGGSPSSRCRLEPWQSLKSRWGEKFNVVWWKWHSQWKNDPEAGEVTRTMRCQELIVCAELIRGEIWGNEDWLRSWPSLKVSMLKPRRGRPHVYKVGICLELTSAHISILVVTALFWVQDKKTEFTRPSHSMVWAIYTLFSVFFLVIFFVF